jgi:hypothetical protein
MQAVLDAIAEGRLGMETSIMISNNRKARRPLECPTP